MKKIVLILFFITLAFGDFPTLNGRVTDDANLFGSKTKQMIIQKIKDTETNSNVFIVVATVKSLDGDEISDYGVKLGRHWGIGEKDKDNGVLLLIAPKERRVNISVGYGLEGVLTDALSSDIIQNKIIPKLKTGDYEKGALSGVNAIISVLNGEYNTLEIISKYLKAFTVIQTTYPQDTDFDITSYSPWGLFIVLFVVSFLFMMISPAFKSALPFLIFGFTALGSFLIMIITLITGDFFSGGSNYFLVALCAVFVGFFSYKNRNYKKD